MRIPLATEFVRIAQRFAVALTIATASVLPAAAADPQPLVDAQWLKAHLQDQNLTVLDIRSAIDGGGTQAYEAAHIPGSVHSDYGKAGWRVVRNNVPFMLPTVTELEKLIGGLGIDGGARVVVVPAGVSFTDFGAAARVYWTLKVVGVKQVSILDGGFAAWKQAGLPTESGNRKSSPKVFTATLDRSLIAEAADVENARTQGNATLVDARPASYFAGKEKVPAAKAYGHIPGALNVDSAGFYDAKSNRLKAVAELTALAASVPANIPSVSYCNTGHWAATDWFVLNEVLGRKQVKLYDGSMVEWTADARRPIESSRTKWDDLLKTVGLGK